MNAAFLEFDLHFHGALEAFQRGDLFNAVRGVRFALGAANRSGCKRRKQAAMRVQNWLLDAREYGDESHRFN